MSNQNNLNIDSDFYSGIISDYSQIISILNQCSPFVNGNMLSGELRTYYDQLGTSSEISSGISKLVIECENTKIKINEGVETCNATDEEMKWQLESLMENLFNDKTISSDEYMGRTYEERVSYVNNLLASSKKVLEEYEKMYEETFGKGIKASEDSAVCFVNLLTSLGVFVDYTKDETNNLWHVGNQTTLYNKETGCFNVEQLGIVLDYCNNNGVIPAIREYIVDGKSWEESGLDKLFGENLKAGAGVYCSPTTAQWENYDAESIFIQNYVNLYMKDGDEEEQGDFLSDVLTLAKNIRNNVADYNGLDTRSDVANLYNIGYDPTVLWWFNNISNKDYAIELIKGHIRQNDIFAMYDESQELHTECVIMQNDINVLKNDVYNMEQYAKLLPFEPYLSEEGYLNDYAERDYSNYKNKDFSTKKLKYLSQDEVAMLAYIYDKYGKGQADDYYAALEDRRNQRQGFEAMAEFAESLNKEHGFNFIEYLMKNSNTVGLGGTLTSGAAFQIVSNLFPDFYDRMVDAGIATTEGFIDGNYNFIDGLSDFIYADGIRDAKDYEMIYKMKLLMGESIPMQYGNEVYEVGLSEEFSDFQKASYKYLYQYGNTIGNMTIPIVVSYIPYVGKGLSFTLRTVSSVGNNTEDLMQQGLDKNNAYMYGTFLGLSEAVIEQIVGGLPGSAGNVPNGWLGYAKSMLSESMEEVIQTYTSAVITSYATGEPIDLTELSGEALEAALMAIATTGTMNAGGTVTIKVADKVIRTNPNEFKSYKSWKTSLESDVKFTKEGIDYLKRGGNLGLFIMNDTEISVINNEIIENLYKPDFDVIYELDNKQTALINKFYDTMLSGVKSSKEGLDLAARAYNHAMANSETASYAERQLNRLISLKTKNPDFNIQYDPYSRAHANPSLMGVELQCITLNNKYDISTFFHEIGHVLDKNTKDLLSLYLKKTKKIQNRILYQTTPDGNGMNILQPELGTCLTKITQEMLGFVEVNKNESKQVYFSLVAEKIGSTSIDTGELEAQYKQYLIDRFKSIDFLSLCLDMKKNGVDFKTLSLLKRGDIFNPEKLAEYVMKMEEIRFDTEYRVSRQEGLYSILDIVDGLLQGKFMDGKIKYKEESLKSICGHGSEYYKKIPWQIEGIANYNALYMTNSAKYVEMLQSVIGDEGVSVFEDRLNQMVK